MKWDHVRQVVLTVSRETPAEIAMEEIRKNRVIPNLIRALGLGERRWLWVLEFHADGYPHWHLFIENLRGRPGMIGKERIQKLWKRGNVWESYPKDAKHWGAICGYHRKAGYFGSENKAHQLTLPEYLLNQSRVRKYASNFKKEVYKEGSPGTMIADEQSLAKGPGRKRTQKAYRERLKACNTTCKVCKDGAWMSIDAPGSEIREKAETRLETISFKTYQGTHEEIIDFISQVAGHH